MIKGPSQITAEKRALLFDPRATVTGRLKRLAKIPKLDLIKERQAREGGINIKILKQATAKMKRVERGLISKGAPKEEIRIKQALMLERVAADFADNMIESCRRTNTTNEVAGGEKIITKELTSEQIETQLWEKVYGKFVSRVCTKNGAMGKEVLQTIIKLKIFLTVPMQVHKERARHWKSISKITKKLIESGTDPSANLEHEVKRILARFRRPNHPDEKSGLHFAALDTIVAASIYADLLSEQSKKQLKSKEEKEHFWDYAYSEAMQKIYPFIRSDPSLVKSILEFGKYGHESQK